MTDHGGDWAGFLETYGAPPLDFSANISPLGAGIRPAGGGGLSGGGWAVPGPPVPGPAGKAGLLSRRSGGVDSLRQWGGGPDLPSGGGPAA